MEEGRKLTVREQGKHVTTPKAWTKRILLPVWAGHILWFIMSLLFWSKYSKTLSWENKVHSFHSVPYLILPGLIFICFILFRRTILSLRIASWLCRIGLVSQSPNPSLILDEPLRVAVRKQDQKKPREIRTFPTSGILPVGQALLSALGPAAFSATCIGMRTLNLSHAHCPSVV